MSNGADDIGPLIENPCSAFLAIGTFDRLLRVARPGFGWRQDHCFLAHGQGDVYPYEQHDRIDTYYRPRYGLAQDDQVKFFCLMRSICDAGSWYQALTSPVASQTCHALARRRGLSDFYRQ